MSVRMRVIAPLVAVMALVTWAAEPSVAQVAIAGRVLDDDSGRPLVGARVLLLNRYQKVVDYSVTDDTGHFAFKPRHGSRMRLEARAVGYRPTVTPVLWMVGDREFASLEVRLAPNVVLLAPVEIVAMSLPTKLKIEKRADTLRKLVLRKTAENLGLPPSIREKPKKAVQYATGVNGVVKKLAKKNKATVAEYINKLFLNQMTEKTQI